MPTGRSRSLHTPFQLLAGGVEPIAAIYYSRWYDQHTPEVVAQLKKVPAIGISGEPDLEEVATLGHDLIVGSADEIEGPASERLKQIAPTVLVSSDERGDWMSISTAIAHAVGTGDQPTTVTATCEQTVARIRRRWATVLGCQRITSFSFGHDTSDFSVQLPDGAAGEPVAAANVQGINAPLAAAGADQRRAGDGTRSSERSNLLHEACSPGPPGRCRLLHPDDHLGDHRPASLSGAARDNHRSRARGPF